MFVAGARFLSDPSGALFWPDEETLIVADLHLEKGSSFARRGMFLPPYDSRATLALLAKTCARYLPKRVIALGDSFHDRDAPERLPQPERQALRRLCECHEFIWIRGNHDPARCDALNGMQSDTWRVGPITFRHEPRERMASAEIVGHLHPFASLVLRGRHVRGRCFVSDGARAVLPAFGAYTGGLDLSDAAFRGLFARTPDIWLIGRKRVHALGRLAYV
jgi:hypothetical protein